MREELGSVRLYKVEDSLLCEVHTHARRSRLGAYTSAIRICADCFERMRNAIEATYRGIPEAPTEVFDDRGRLL